MEADSTRGDQELVEACRGHDKVHLCRSLTCAEEGQHFKEYGLAKDFDPEKFQLKNAELGAAKAGRTLWAWLWSSCPRDASESEAEPEKPCEAYQVSWVDKEGDFRLATGPRRKQGAVTRQLLCAHHGLDYERDRRSQGCKHPGCDRVGFLDGGGIRRRRQHGGGRRPSTRRRSPSVTRTREPEGDDPEEPDLPPARNKKHHVDQGGLKRMLEDIKGEPGGSDPRRRAKSPGHTPKSSIHRNLAKLGMLESPARDDPPPDL